MSEWKTYELGELCDEVAYGYTASADWKIVGPKFLRITDIQNYFVNWETVPQCPIKANEHKKYKLEEGDIVIARTGATTGTTYTFKGNVDAVFASYLIKFKINKKLANPFYDGYTLKSNIWKEFVASIIGGSAQPGANAKQFSSFEIPLPDLKTQQQIVSILGSIDDAIELNQQINKTLGDMAKAIFKEWFVDFNFPNATGKFQETEIGKIPVGWKVATFEDVFDADRGLSYKGSGLVESDATPMHNLNSVLEGGGYKTIGIKYYNGDYKDKHIVNAGEVIVANTEQGHKYLLIGYPAIIPQFYGEHGIFSHHIYRLRPKPNCYLSPDFIYHLLLQQQVRDQVVGFANGTTVNMLKIEGLKKPKLAMPPKELAEKFGAIARANRLQAEQNIEENQSLMNLRDTLLPKLMKGEININL